MWEGSNKREKPINPVPCFLKHRKAGLSLIDIRCIQSTLAKRQACVRSAQLPNEESLRRHTVFLVGHDGEVVSTIASFSRQCSMQSLNCRYYWNFPFNVYKTLCFEVRVRYPSQLSITVRNNPCLPFSTSCCYNSVYISLLYLLNKEISKVLLMLDHLKIHNPK